MYQLSRPVNPNETIDFFMSHSWHDDACTKWKLLKAFAASFRRKHGRFPTFWLDKVCINQESISDGLKVLPVNVMACRRVLVLCGNTYPDRLWCIWELFTLLCFSDDNETSSRVKFISYGPDCSATLDRLMSFSIRNAHCYDPNEESKLKAVIRAGGQALFESKIQTLALDIVPVDQAITKRTFPTELHVELSSKSGVGST